MSQGTESQHEGVSDKIVGGIEGTAKVVQAAVSATGETARLTLEVTAETSRTTGEIASEAIANIGGVKDRLIDALKTGSQDVGKFLYRNTLGSTFNLFGIIHGDTSWSPVETHSDRPSALRKSMGMISVAVPLIYDGKDYPAVRNMRPVQYVDPDFPRVNVRFEDGVRQIIGDEVVFIELAGEPLKLFPDATRSIAWHLWMPQSAEVVISARRKDKPEEKVRKSQIELTASDIITLLRDQIHETTEGHVDIHPDHLFGAISMISQGSESFRARLQASVDRFEFQKYLTLYPEYIAGQIQGVVELPSAEFAKLVDDLRNGEVKNWSGLLNRLDKIPSEIGQGSSKILPRLLKGAHQLVPDAHEISQVEPISRSALFGSLGVSMMVADLHGYHNEVTDVLRRIGAKQATRRLKLFETIEMTIDADITALEAAKGRIAARQQEINQHMIATVDRLIEEKKAVAAMQLNPANTKQINSKP